MSPPADIRIDRGTAAQTGAADIASFGALPVAAIGGATLFPAGIVDAEAMPRIAFAAAPAEARSSSDGVDSVAHIAGADADAVAGALTLTAIAAPVIGSPAIVGDGHVPAASAAAVSSGIATFVPMTHGSGAVASFVGSGSIEAVHPAAETLAAGVSSPVHAADSIESIRTSVVALQDAIDAIAGRLPPAMAEGHHPAAITDTLAAADHVLTSASDAARATLDHAGDAVDHLGLVAGSALDQAVAGVGSITAPVIDTGAILEGLGGGDPHGGIVTLVGMVSAADAFDLHDTGAPALSALSPALGAIGSADLLAAIAPHDVLLGLGDHHGGGIAGIDLHDGLFGH